MMQCHVTRCIICISNKVEYLDKEHSKIEKFRQRNYIVIFAMQPRKYWTKFRVIGTLRSRGLKPDSHMLPTSVTTIVGDCSYE